LQASVASDRVASFGGGAGPPSDARTITTGRRDNFPHTRQVERLQRERRSQPLHHERVELIAGDLVKKGWRHGASHEYMVRADSLYYLYDAPITKDERAACKRESAREQHGSAARVFGSSY